MDARLLLLLLASSSLCERTSRRNANPPPASGELAGGLDHRLTRLEVLMAEKLDNLRGEVRENGQRLQALEWQSAETHKFLEGLRMDLSRLVQYSAAPQHSGRNPELDQRIMNLEAGIQVLIAATKPIFADMEAIRKNISALTGDTKKLLYSTSLLSNEYLTHGVSDLKQPSSCAASVLPKHCRDVNGGSGLYRIQPEHAPKPILVQCDMGTRGGGWIVVQSRFDGSQDFYQSYRHYKLGFGNLGGEFWIGLENLHHLTGYDVSELVVELQDHTRQNRTAYYSVFSVGSEDEGFPLKVLAGYSGDAGDSLSYHAGNRFSAKDLDQDAWPEGSCAQAHSGGWWYRNCDASNLNGKYLGGELPEQYIYQGIYWGGFRGAQYSLARSRILVRPRDHDLPLNEVFNMSPKAKRQDQEEDEPIETKF